MKWLGIIGNVAIVVVLVIVGYAVYKFLRPDRLETFLDTQLIAAHGADTLITGFASVTRVVFYEGNTERPMSFLTAAPVGEEKQRAARVDGFCYRLYDITIGYPSLAGALDLISGPPDEWAVPAPQVLSANAVDSRHGGRAVSQLRCDAMDRVGVGRSNTDRLLAIQARMDADGQWMTHVVHSRQVLLSFSREHAGNRAAYLAAQLGQVGAAETAWRARAAETRETPEVEAIATRGGVLDPVTARVVLDEHGFTERIGERLAQRRAQLELQLANASGYLGALQLTFSTVGIFSVRNRVLIFFRTQDFYFRQDLSTATYGSPVSLSWDALTPGWFGAPSIRIALPQPRLLSVDRYIAALASDTDDFNVGAGADEPATARIESEMRRSLDERMRHVDSAAVALAQSLIAQLLQDLGRQHGVAVSVRFVGADRLPGDGVGDLLSLFEMARRPAGDDAP